MRKSEIDDLLATMLDSHDNVSDRDRRSGPDVNHARELGPQHRHQRVSNIFDIHKIALLQPFRALRLSTAQKRRHSGRHQPPFRFSRPVRVENTAPRYLNSDLRSHARRDQAERVLASAV